MPKYILISFLLFSFSLAQTDTTYPFKPGDGIQISTFPDSTFLSRVFPIDDRGYAEFPIVGEIDVSKMTEQELVDFIKSTYTNYLRHPNVRVKPVVRISMLGGFMRPGLYYVDINSSLWEAVHLAGGTLLEDGIYEMRWERNHDDVVDDTAPVFERGISLRELGFKSGDQIWTPSPAARTFWDTIRDVMPILTFSTTLWAIYNTYQRDAILLRGVR